jgi:hypothetical protein
MDTLSQKVQLAAQRGHGVIYFYWEGLWGRYSGREGSAYRQATFGQLHNAVFGDGGARVATPFRPSPPVVAQPSSVAQPPSPQRSSPLPSSPPPPLPPIEAEEGPVLPAPLTQRPLRRPPPLLPPLP